MDKKKVLTADQILAISKENYASLFSSDGLMDEFRHLRAHWHPDKNTDPKATDVFQHIYDLFHEAELAKESGIWKGPSSIKIMTIKGNMTFNYVKAHEFELGMLYIGRRRILYVVRPEFEPLFDNAVKRLSQIAYADERMRKEFERYLPKIEMVSKTITALCLLIEKTEEVVLLRDLLDHLGGQMEPKHAAWVMNRLYNLAAFFQFNQISHQAISLDTMFVSAQFHTIMPYGGWWYTMPLKTPVQSVPGVLKPFYPAELLKKKLATTATDPRLIQVVGMQLLGDSSGTGMSLIKGKNIPDAVLQYLKGPGNNDAIQAYKAWSSCVKASFGERKFIPLPNASATDIYQ